MLKTKTLIDKLGKEYEPMLKKVDIPNFTKCIAQYSGIDMKELKDEVIEGYLTTWAENKKHFFDLFGDLVVDIPIEYIDKNTKTTEKIMQIARQYPAYYYWCEIFNCQTENKIDFGELPYDFRSREIEDIFPGYRIDGTTITHFFKEKLKAPDEVVTAIGRVFEHNKVSAIYTLSIDPVDIMTSSENPYKWTSCYRLEHPFRGSHADGCLAGVLDHDTIISYIWNKSGKLSLYNKYELKDVRYKKVRMTIAVNNTLNAIHFNEIYPWKTNTPDDFRKMLRDKVETYFAEKAGLKNLWSHLDRYIGDKNNYDFISYLHIYREYSEYGYGEYGSDHVYFIKGQEYYEPFQIYNKEIMCPCGCGSTYIGSDTDEDEYDYDGYGHTNEHYDESDEDTWDEWRVYDNDDDEIYSTVDGLETAIEWAEENDEAVYVEHHWGGNYWSDYEREWTKPDPDPSELEGYNNNDITISTDDLTSQTVTWTISNGNGPALTINDIDMNNIEYSQHIDNMIQDYINRNTSITGTVYLNEQSVIAQEPHNENARSE